MSSKHVPSICEWCGFDLNEEGVCDECGFDAFAAELDDDGYFEPDDDEIAMLGEDGQE